MTNSERDIGRLEAVVSSLEKQNEELKAEIKILRDEINEIKSLILQFKGGSRIVLWIGGLISGGAGAALFKLLPIIFSR